MDEALVAARWPLRPHRRFKKAHIHDNQYFGRSVAAAARPPLPCWIPFLFSCQLLIDPGRRVSGRRIAAADYANLTPSDRRPLPAEPTTNPTRALFITHPPPALPPALLLLLPLLLIPLFRSLPLALCSSCPAASCARPNTVRFRLPAHARKADWPNRTRLWTRNAKGVRLPASMHPSPHRSPLPFSSSPSIPLFLLFSDPSRRTATITCASPTMPGTPTSSRSTHTISPSTGRPAAAAPLPSSP